MNTKLNEQKLQFPNHLVLYFTRTSVLTKDKETRKLKNTIGNLSNVNSCAKSGQNFINLKSDTKFSYENNSNKEKKFRNVNKENKIKKKTFSL